MTEGRLPPTEELFNTQQQQQQQLDPAFFMPIFRESYRLQASEDDVISAAEGFDAVARARRGEPWPGRAPAAADPTCSSTGGKRSIMQIDADDGGDSNNNNSSSSDTEDTPCCVDAFLDAYKSNVETYSRTTHRWSDGGVSQAWCSSVVTRHHINHVY